MRPLPTPVPAPEHAPAPAMRSRRSRAGLVMVAVLVLIAAAAGLLYFNRHVILAALAPQDMRAGQAGEATQRPAERPKIVDRLPQEGVARPTAPAGTAAGGEPQSSQPKTADQAPAPSAADSGSAAPGAAAPGSATPSIAAPTPAAPAPAEKAAPSTPAPAAQNQPTPAPTVAPVAQQAVLLEESQSVAKPEARYTGRVNWRLETEAGPNGPRPVVKGVVEIPDRSLKMQLTLKRNDDPNLPASHVLDLLFEVPSSFDGGGVANVAGVLVRESAVARSVPLVAQVARVTDGYFMVALANGDAERRRNLELLRSGNWFDIPIIYANGRRAMLSLEKGTPGEQIFRQALDAWGT